EGRVGVRDYLASRPVVAELEAIGRAILYAGETGCALHIVHVSSGRGVALVAEARARGVDVSCETCAHYLALTDEDAERIGALAKCAPPLRGRDEQAALWQQLLDGTLPMVTSDHSPAPASMKTGDDFFKIWGGISGCQSLLAVLLTEGHARRRLPLATVAASTAGYVAQRFGLAPRKGRIAEGADADLALVDMRQRYRLDAADLQYRHRHSPYVGREFHGRVVRTLLRGATIFRDGRAVAAKPAGQLLTP
ncbi:MAG TPA: amidohydrolase family protein, partial [Kouleothrix sp.]|nr:amidohydrolase family protein [Kouleothrix sp.]